MSAVTKRVRDLAQSGHTHTAIAALVRASYFAPWLDGHEVRRILDRKPKGAPRFTDRQLGNAVRMRDEGATWPEIADVLHCDRHTASKYVRAAQQARGQR